MHYRVYFGSTDAVCSTHSRVCKANCAVCDVCSATNAAYVSMFTINVLHIALFKHRVYFGPTDAVCCVLHIVVCAKQIVQCAMYFEVSSRVASWR